MNKTNHVYMTKHDILISRILDLTRSYGDMMEMYVLANYHSPEANRNPKTYKHLAERSLSQIEKLLRENMQ